MSVAERLFVALDVPSARQALDLVAELAPLGVRFKVGMQLFYAEGLPLVRAIQEQGGTVFVDLKLHDIPNTVAGAVDSLVRGGVCYLNVHAQGGPAMMRAAAEAARRSAEAAGIPQPTVLAVTILTSLDEHDLQEFLYVNQLTLSQYVTHLARQARDAGLDGVVCSPREASTLRQACGPDFLLVTPGIRPAGQDGGDDQARVLTAGEAMRAGADCLVVGRPITGAASPRKVAEQLLREMEVAVLA